jgi:hypothetical protein
MAARHGLVVMQQKICHYAAAGSGYLTYDVNIGIVNMVDYCTVRIIKTFNKIKCKNVTIIDTYN